ncbi:hypothetical protein D3C81_1292680 [compost metagenome]
MLGAGQADKAVVDVGLVHFCLEVIDLLGVDHAVRCAVLDQDPGLHRAGGGRGGGGKGAVEADHAGQGHALAGHVQHHLAAEAVADGCQLLLVGPRLLLEQVEAGEEALAGGIGVGRRRLHEALGVGRVGGVPAFAIHVDGQGAVAEGREVAGAALGVVVQSPPLMHHHHPGAFAGNSVVPGVVADQLRAVGTLVGDFLGLDGGVTQAAERKQYADQAGTHDKSSGLTDSQA